MTTQNIASLIGLAATRKSTFGFSMETETKARLTKGALIRIFGSDKVSVVKHTTITNAFLGRNYQSNVRAHSVRDGGDGDFKSMKPRGMHWAAGLRDFVLESDSDPSKWYLRVGISPSATRIQARYTVDGRPATPTETSAIEDALPKSGGFGRQYEAGVAEGDEVVVKNYAIESIVSANAWGVIL